MKFKDLVREIGEIKSEGDRQGVYNLIDYSYQLREISGDDRKLLISIAYKIDAYAEMYSDDALF